MTLLKLPCDFSTEETRSGETTANPGKLLNENTLPGADLLGPLRLFRYVHMRLLNLFTHKNGNLGAISVTEKVERRISDTFV